MPAIEIDPLGNFLRNVIIDAGQIEKFEMNIKSFKDPLKTSLYEVVIPSIDRNFAAQGRPPWKRLSQRTILNRLYEGFPRGPILDKTGRLKRESLRKNIWKISATELNLMANYYTQKIPYAKFHQFGARIPRSRIVRHITGRIGPGGTFRRFQFSTQLQRNLTGEHGKLPMRPFMQLTVDEEVQVYGIFFNWLSDKVDKYWGNPSGKHRAE